LLKSGTKIEFKFNAQQYKKVKKFFEKEQFNNKLRIEYTKEDKVYLSNLLEYFLEYLRNM